MGPSCRRRHKHSSLRPTNGDRSTPASATSSHGFTMARNSSIKSFTSRASKNVRPPIRIDGTPNISRARCTGPIAALVRVRIAMSANVAGRCAPGSPIIRTPANSVIRLATQRASSQAAESVSSANPPINSRLGAGLSGNSRAPINECGTMPGEAAEKTWFTWLRISLRLR